MPLVANRRGLGRTGCLFWLMVIVVLGYFGADIAAVYWRRYQLWDEIQTQARFAPNLTDDVIRRRLEAKVDDLALPAQAKQFVIRRTTRPREIIIRTEYEETVELPFTVRTFSFTLLVREQI